MKLKWPIGTSSLWEGREKRNIKKCIIIDESRLMVLLVLVMAYERFNQIQFEWGGATSSHLPTNNLVQVIWFLFLRRVDVLSGDGDRPGSIPGLNCGTTYSHLVSQ
jgi:hypothetical protein